MTYDDYRRRALNSFTPGPDHRPKRGGPHRIKVRGEWVQLASGKTIWKQIGHAKCALRNHLSTLPASMGFRYTYPDEEFVNRFLREGESEGWLEFVPVEGGS